VRPTLIYCAVALAAFSVSSCGAADSLETSGDPSAVALDSAAMDPFPEALPRAECLSYVSDWMSGADVVLQASSARFGPREVTTLEPLMGKTAAIRTVELEGVNVLSGEVSESISELRDVEAVLDDSGAVIPMSGMDPQLTSNVKDALVLVKTVETRGKKVYYLSGIAFEIDGQVSFGTQCTEPIGRVLDKVAAQLGEPPFVALSNWLSVKGTRDEDRYRDAEAEATSDDFDRVNAWLEASPLVRSLDPLDVPSDLRPVLEVHGAVVDVVGLKVGQVVLLRTDSGVSSSVAPAAMGSTIPLFSLADRDTFVEVVVAELGAFETGTVIGQMKLEALQYLGGFRVTGTVERAEFELLDAETLSKELGVTVEQLEALRDELLEPETTD
jgi:hypothetical protein